MQDEGILKQIEQLVEEERQLYESDPQDAGKSARLKRLEVELDRCWDLLRQRRALREFGDDPESAALRSGETVEHYR